MENIKLFNGGMTFEMWYKEREKDFYNITYMQTTEMIQNILDRIGNLCEDIVNESVGGRRYTDDRGDHMKGYLVYNSRLTIYVYKQKIATLIQSIFSISIDEDNNPTYHEKYYYDNIGYSLSKNISEKFIEYVFQKAYEFKYISREQFDVYFKKDDWYTDEVFIIDD